MDALAVALYALAVAGFFWQVLFLPDVALPKGGGDLASFLYPTYAFAAENIQRGIFPLWNPYLFGGMPFAADMQSGLYYPLNLIAFLLARPFSYQTVEALAIVHYLLGAAFAYAFGRVLGLSRAGAFAVGLIFAFGGFSVAHLAHLNMLAAATWLPLILLLMHKAVTMGSHRWAAASGVAFGIAILAGHTQISLYTALFLALYWLWGVLYPARHKEREVSQTTSRRKLLTVLPICLAVAFALAAVQLLPLIELLRLSLRADLSYARALEFAASPLGFVTLFVPHFFGDSPADFWGLRWSLTEVYGYAGILTWALAGLALWVARPLRRWTVFFALAALLALLLSLGEHTVFYGWLYRFVPGFDKVRAAGRFLLLFDLALAVLAGYGINQLGRPLRARWRPAYARLVGATGIALGGAILVGGPLFYHALLTSQDKDPAIFQRLAIAIDSYNLSILFLALTVVLLVLYRRRWSKYLPYLALLLLAVDLFGANARLNPTTEDIAKSFRHPELVAFLHSVSPARIDSATGVADVLQPDAGLLYGLPDVSGLFNPMALADYQRYWENLGSRSVAGYDLLASGYLVGKKDVPLDWAKFELAFSRDPEVNVYHNRAALPRAFFASEVTQLSREEQLDRLRAVDFDAGRTLLLDPGVGLPSVTGGAGKVRETDYPSPNELRVSVDTPSPGYLVLSEVYYPGWRAFADGREVPVLRADYTFRAVLLPAGAREVRLVFDPALWRLGLLISLATLGGLLLWAISRVVVRTALIPLNALTSAPWIGKADSSQPALLERAKR